MAAFDFNGSGAHALSDKTFQVGMDRAVLGGHDVPARLRLPGDAVDLLREQVRHGNGLRCPDDLLLRLGQISGKGAHPIRTQPNPPIGDLDVGKDIRDGELLLLALRGFCLIGREGGDVNQGGDAVVRSCGGA